MMTEANRDIASDLTAWCRSRLREIFATHGYFPSSHQLLFSRDPDFDWKRRARVFRTTPHLRWELIATAILHAVRGTRRDRQGRARRLSHQAFFSGDAQAFYFNALISDCLDASREGGLPEEWEREWEALAVREYESDALEYAQGDGVIPAWAYFPRITHRFKPGNVIHRLMHGWGALAADLDTTAVVLCRLLAARSERIPIPAMLTLLEDHVHGRGRHGREPLAYDNGALAEDAGVLLWVHEKHNELDAGVNLNVLCLLAGLVENADPDGRERAIALAAGALDFLDRHIALGSYARGGFLMFYSIEAMAFLWHRFAARLAGLPEALRARFDPRDVCGRLGAHLAGLVEARLPAANAFDALLALPLLLRVGSPSAARLASPESLRSLAETVSGHAYEFGKFVYPATFLYGNRALGPCAVMMACLELRRQGNLHDT